MYVAYIYCSADIIQVTQEATHHQDLVKWVAGCQCFSCLFSTKSFSSLLQALLVFQNLISLSFSRFLSLKLVFNCQFCCYASFWLAQIQPAFSNKCIISWILMIITRLCLVTVTCTLQALVQLLAQTRDNLQYPQDNIILQLVLYIHA